MEPNDTPTGGESLSIDQAVAGYVKATTPEAIQKDDAEVGDETDGTTTDDELQASDEDVSEETDGETASEDDAEQSDDDEPDSDQGRFVADNAKVRLADGTVTTVHELKRGNLREADYTRKRQEDAALHTETAAKRERIEAKDKQLDEQRTYMAQLIQSIVPPEPDPSRAVNDPAGYTADKAKRDYWLSHLQAIHQGQQRSAEERQAKADGETKERGEREWGALLGKMPELKDEKRLEALVGDINKHGENFGFSKQELSTVAGDHRLIVVLAKAIKWDKLQASKATVQKKVEGRPPVQKGGKRLNPNEHRARATSDAMNRLKQSGSVEDATAAYIASLNKG